MKIKFKKTDLIYLVIALVMIGYNYWDKFHERSDITGKCDGYEYVDLGLKSGTLWATCNIGANISTDYGEYFAWGETTPKNDYSDSTLNGSDKYNPEDSNVLSSCDDAATANWGENWRTPTLIEMRELLFGCRWVWTDNFKLTGVAGRVGYSKANGKKIFLPAAGYRTDTLLRYTKQYGFYWTSNASKKANSLYFHENDIDQSTDKRSLGYSVRAVVGWKK